jgi:putative addiction module component (TIGR02574 family)
MSAARANVERAALQLSAKERLDLATALYESVERDAAATELRDWQRKVLAERLVDDEAGDNPGEPWEVVKARILADL